jgi:hypothetical protein
MRSADKYTSQLYVAASDAERFACAVATSTCVCNGISIFTLNTSHREREKKRKVNVHSFTSHFTDFIS